MREKFQPTIYTGCIPKRRTYVGSRRMTEDVPLVNCIPHSHVPDDYPAAFENNERKVISWTDVCVLLSSSVNDFDVVYKQDYRLRICFRLYIITPRYYKSVYR